MLEGIKARATAKIKLAMKPVAVPVMVFMPWVKGKGEL